MNKSSSSSSNNNNNNNTVSLFTDTLFNVMSLFF